MTGIGGNPVPVKGGGDQTIGATEGGLALGRMIDVGQGLVQGPTTEVTDVLARGRKIANKAGGLDLALIPGGVVVTEDRVIVITRGLLPDLWKNRKRENHGLHRQERTIREKAHDQERQRRQ